MLLGFVRPAAGRVLVGGADLAGLDLAQWHARVAWVPQRPHLFAGTIAENVRLARPDADGTAVRRALRDAGRWSSSTRCPRAWTRSSGRRDRAVRGQRQRLALARAFLADRPVLLLDEPTAALDGATEAEVVAAVRRLAEGRTVLLVVHRPALLEVADRVVRLEEPPAGTAPAAAGDAALDRRVDEGVPLGETAEPVAAGTAPEARGGVLARVRAMSAARRGGSVWRCCSAASRSAVPSV